MCRIAEGRLEPLLISGKFKAVNNRDRNFTCAKMQRRMEQIEESVARYLHQMDSADRQETSLANTTSDRELSVRVKPLELGNQAGENIGKWHVAEGHRPDPVQQPTVQRLNLTGELAAALLANARGAPH